MTNETELREYLLGRLPESDSERLENRLLDDDELFLTTRSVEDDLFDDFARSRLDAADREQFLKRYGAQNRRLTFARALAQRGPNVVAFPRRRWIGWAAAAAVVIAMGTLLMTRVESPDAKPVARRRDAGGTAAGTAAVLVTLGTSRSAGATSTVTLPKDASTLRLRVRLNPDDRFDRYAMELRSDRVVWRADDLHSSIEGGELIVSAAVPASALADGSYELAVRGGGEDLGFVTLEVHRTK